MHCAAISHGLLQSTWRQKDVYVSCLRTERLKNLTYKFTMSGLVLQSMTDGAKEQTMMPVEVRAQLTDALRLDLAGPGEVLGADGRVLGDANEILPQRPS